MSNKLEEELAAAQGLQDLAYVLVDISYVLTLFDYEAAGWTNCDSLAPEAQKVYKNGIIGLVGVLSHEAKRVSERMSDIAEVA
jgi:hypothetical protein